VDYRYNSAKYYAMNLSTDALLRDFDADILPFPHALPWEDQVRWC